VSEEINMKRVLRGLSVNTIETASDCTASVVWLLCATASPSHHHCPHVPSPQTRCQMQKFTRSLKHENMTAAPRVGGGLRKRPSEAESRVGELWRFALWERANLQLPHLGFLRCNKGSARARHRLGMHAFFGGGRFKVWWSYLPSVANENALMRRKS
jgi:hypothetical protein